MPHDLSFTLRRGRRTAANRHSRTAKGARRIATFAVPVLVLGLIAHRTGYADTPAALAVFGMVFLMAGIAAVLALAAIASIWRDGGEGAGMAVGALFVALALLAVPTTAAVFAWRLPLINDIVTDPLDVPEFQTLIAARQRENAAVAYAFEQNAEAQVAAYPQIVPYVFQMDFPDAVTLVRDVTERAGWEIVATRQISRTRAGTTVVETLPFDPTGEALPPGAEPPVVTEIPLPRPRPPDGPAPEFREAMIEATAHTPIFGFADDLVIRVREAEAGIRVDMRSASRFGAHDFGTNARRIRRFLKMLDEAVKDSTRI